MMRSRSPSSCTTALAMGFALATASSALAEEPPTALTSGWASKAVESKKPPRTVVVEEHHQALSAEYHNILTHSAALHHFARRPPRQVSRALMQRRAKEIAQSVAAAQSSLAALEMYMKNDKAVMALLKAERPHQRAALVRSEKLTEEADKQAPELSKVADLTRQIFNSIEQAHRQHERVVKMRGTSKAHGAPSAGSSKK